MGNGWRRLVGLGALLVCVGAGMGAAAGPDSRPLGVLSASPKGVTASGLRSLDGADGVTALVSSPAGGGLTNAQGVTPASTFLYFDVEAQAPAGAWGPVYVSVEYFDRAIGANLGLQYDSATGDAQGARYLGADDQAGGWFTGSRQWRQACFLLRKPLFQGRENLGADFRLAGSQILVRRVSVSTVRPADWQKLSHMPAAKIKPLVRIGAGGQLIVGGFDPARTSDGIPQSRALEAAVPALKSLGVTSHECYVRWNLCEPSPGKYDWSVYDRFVRVYQRHGLKWVPFLIIGSAYSLPNWYYKKPGFQGYVCLEHGQECDVQSLWNPVLRKHVARFIKAFLDHYRGAGVIESVLLGVTGNYGEAIYPATGNDWTADIHGPTHTHPGFWAGDPYAVKSFRAWLTRKYKGNAVLRGAWGASAPELARARPFLRDAAPNDRAWLDFCAWYIGSMTDWSRFWLRQTRASLPEGGIYLCTGGHAPAEHGSDFGDQCKAAAEVKGGVRITNEGSDYKANFSLTRWVASGGEQYGAYYSFEPAGEVNPIGVIGRVYNATASGALGLHYYYPNIYGSEEAQRNFAKWGGQ
ncbi:MAG TPA: family 14 glycosylhydrolase, partial [Armatimonadota bacterium]